MAKMLYSLNTKLVVSFVVLVVAISGMSFLYTYGETKKALLESTQDTLRELSSAMASQIPASSVTELQPGDEESAQYQDLIAQMREMRNMSDMVVNCYVFKINGTQLEFLADDAEDGPAEIGYVYDTPDHDLIVAALDGPTVSEQIYTDEYGSFLSGYAPITNESGVAVAVFGVDMDASNVIERQEFIGNTIYLIMGAGVLIAAVIVGIFALTIIKDIKKLNETANKISTGDMDVTVDVKRKDEIGDLAESFSRMVASLKFEMLMRQEEELAKKEQEAARKGDDRESK